VVRRDDGTKSAVAVESAVAGVPALLDTIQDDLLASATQAREAATAEVSTIDEAGEAAATGFAQVPWRTLVDNDGEARLRELGVTVRVLQRPDGTLPASEDEPDTVAVVARSY
jgi:prolyl-tRNA synthetase